MDAGNKINKLRPTFPTKSGRAAFAAIYCVRCSELPFGERDREEKKKPKIHS